MWGRMYLCWCVNISNVYIYQLLRTSKMWLKVNFSAEFNWFEFSVFLLDQFLYHGKRAHSAILFAHS